MFLLQFLKMEHPGTKPKRSSSRRNTKIVYLFLVCLVCGPLIYRIFSEMPAPSAIEWEQKNKKNVSSPSSATMPSKNGTASTVTSSTVSSVPEDIGVLVNCNTNSPTVQLLRSTYGWNDLNGKELEEQLSAGTVPISMLLFCDKSVQLIVKFTWVSKMVRIGLMTNDLEASIKMDSLVAEQMLVANVDVVVGATFENLRPYYNESLRYHLPKVVDMNATALQVHAGLRQPKIRTRRNIAIACGFNYKKDPQRRKITKASRGYMRLWYTSIHKQPNMKGILLGNMYDEAFRMEYATEQVEFVYVDPESHPSFVDDPKSALYSINDQVYFVVDWYLKNGRNLQDNVEYVVVTDLGDVEFLNDPFPFMAAMDGVMQHPQVYVGEEFGVAEGELKWLDNVFWRCFKERNQHRFMMYNSGIVGGTFKTLSEFISKMIVQFKSVPDKKKRKNCNMAIFGRVIFDDYQSNVISGYPLHSKFREPFQRELSDGMAYIRHKKKR
jgi:hypothetical protein